MTNREISLNRAEELNKTILPYLEAKRNIGYGKSSDKKRLFEESKTLILKHLSATSDDVFNNWKWQFNNRFTESAKLDFFFHFSKSEKENIDKVTEIYRFSITPYYLSLINPDNEQDPLKKMALVSIRELDESGTMDPMLEEQTNPCGIITRRYPDRLTLNITNTCAMHCRYCQRRRKFGEIDKVSSKEDIETSIDYIRKNQEIRDVLITGGDPFTLSDESIDELLHKIHKIPHVQIIRIGTRTPVTMPQRITPELAAILKKYHPLYINTQFNHPAEITEESSNACTILADSGISLGNQMVLLKDVNDDENVVRFLNEELLRIRVRPYYIFHPQQVTGTSHFYVPLKKGLSIMGKLRGNTSGMAIPTYIVNSPDGLGKVPILPKYFEELEQGKFALTTWEGKTKYLYEN